MQIYTSYFSMMKKIPNNLTCVSISLNPPSWFHGLQFKKLAPNRNILNEWKLNHDPTLYEKRFKNEILNNLDPNQVFNDLKILSKNKDVILLCYERSKDFCHRHLVSKWLNHHLKLNIKELTF